MCRSTIRFSCARFMMLSLKGARQISGNKVTMSILIGKKTSNVECTTSNIEIAGCFSEPNRREPSDTNGMPEGGELAGTSKSNAAASGTNALQLFYDLKYRALTVTRCRTGQ